MSASKNPNILLILLRQLHAYLGLFMALFILLVAFTGIWLNHKHSLGNALGRPEPVRGQQQLLQQQSQQKSQASGDTASAIAASQPASPASSSKPKSLGKIMHDLHTGQIIGLPGTLLSDAVGLVMMFLTLSGLYMWCVPVWRRMRRDHQALRARITGTSEQPVHPSCTTTSRESPVA